MSEDTEVRAVDQTLRFTGRDPRACETCINAHGEPPWEDGPNKSYCMAYPRSAGERKPPSVYYEGGPCKFHREA